MKFLIAYKKLAAITILFALLFAITNANAQKTDTVCLTIRDALHVLAAADSAKVLKDNVDLLKKDTALMGLRIRNLQAAVADLKVADSIASKEIVAKYERQIEFMKEQVQIASDSITRMDREITKQKRKKKWITVAGIAGIIATVLIMK